MFWWQELFGTIRDKKLSPRKQKISPRSQFGKKRRNTACATTTHEPPNNTEGHKKASFLLTIIRLRGEHEISEDWDNSAHFLAKNLDMNTYGGFLSLLGTSQRSS